MLDKIAPFNVERVREDFPILKKEVYGKPLVYLDNGASAQKPQAVLDTITEVMTGEYANVHRGLHYMANAATRRYEEAREKVATFLNARETGEIVFTSGVTDAINLVAYSYAMPRLQEGDEILLTQMEHHSNIVPWDFLRKHQGVKLVFAPVEEDGSFSLERFSELLSERTKLVAITHMSNVLGTVVPAKEVCRIAHERGVPVLFDGAQGAVHLPVDVQDIDCDFYTVNAHKLYGPTGVGALYAKRELLEQMRPFKGGGEMIRSVSEEEVTYADPPMRFEAGTPPIVQAIAFGAAIDYVSALDRTGVAQHEDDLLHYATERLDAIEGVRIIGRAPGKGAIVSFVMDGLHAHDVATIIDRSGVAVRAGHHCAEPLMQRYGVTATLRASFGLYNTRGEVDTFVAALEKAREMLS